MKAEGVAGVAADASPVRHRPPLFSDSVVVRYAGFDFELKPYGVCGQQSLLERVRADVLEVAARSRGWDTSEQIAAFAEVFKIEPLFEADGLALLWEGERLVGLAGICYESGPGDALVLHTCSLGLLPEAQNRGFLPTLFALLWEVVDQLAGVDSLYRLGRVYLTAITQSPFIVAFLGQVSDLFPGPRRDAADADMLAVARRIVARFDPEVPFDPETFVLRNECGFFYHRIPYSTDRLVNAYCDEHLRYGEGDTFVLVGRANRTAVRRFQQSAERAHPDLFAALRPGLLRVLSESEPGYQLAPAAKGAS